MKNTYIAFYLFCLFGLLFVSCKKEDDGIEKGKVVYSGQDFVIFEEAAGSVPESVTTEDAKKVEIVSPGAATIAVSRSSKDRSQPLTVNYTVTSKYANGGATAASTFNISNASQVTIPAGQSKAFITVTTVNNALTDGAKEVTITLTGASDPQLSVGYPGPEGGNKSFVLTIDDDDCPFDLSAFPGTYNVVYTVGGEGIVWGTGVISSPSKDAPKFVSRIKLGTQPNTLEDDNFYAIQTAKPLFDPPFSQVNTAVVIKLIPGSLTTAIDEQNLYFTGGGSERRVKAESVPGKIKTCGPSFTVTFQVVRNTGTIGATVTATYTKQ